MERLTFKCRILWLYWLWAPG